jgi:hypothetical protein
MASSSEIELHFPGGEDRTDLPTTTGTSANPAMTDLRSVSGESSPMESTAFVQIETNGTVIPSLERQQKMSPIEVNGQIDGTASHDTTPDPDAEQNADHKDHISIFEGSAESIEEKISISDTQNLKQAPDDSKNAEMKASAYTMYEPQEQEDLGRTIPVNERQNGSSPVSIAIQPDESLQQHNQAQEEAIPVNMIKQKHPPVEHVEVAGNSQQGQQQNAPSDNEVVSMPRPAAASNEVIVLDDSDDEQDCSGSERDAKRQRLDELTAAPLPEKPSASTSHHKRKSSLPKWMQEAADSRGVPIQAGRSLSGHIQHLSGHMDAIAAAAAIEQKNGGAPLPNPPITYPMRNHAVASMPNPLVPPARPAQKYDEPQYFALPPGHRPTWEHILPAPPPPPKQGSLNDMRSKHFQLSLLNVKEFTIVGLPVTYDSPQTPISGLRVPIRQISREHGKAVYQLDKEGNKGKWRIPLGAYHAFYAYLTSLPNCRVDGIPQHQLQIASLERARQEKGYPSVEKLVSDGVPKGLANALAPFQRGGVDFVLEKKGRALIADGKAFAGHASLILHMMPFRAALTEPISVSRNGFRKDDPGNRLNVGI